MLHKVLVTNIARAIGQHGSSHLASQAASRQCSISLWCVVEDVISICLTLQYWVCHYFIIVRYISFENETHGGSKPRDTRAHDCCLQKYQHFYPQMLLLLPRCVMFSEDRISEDRSGQIQFALHRLPLVTITGTYCLGSCKISQYQSVYQRE